MISKLWRNAAAALVVVALGASLALAAKEATKETSNETSPFRPAPMRDASGIEQINDNSMATSTVGARPLGQTRSSAVGVGFAVGTTWSDAQFNANSPRRVASRNTNIVSLSFTGQPNATAATAFFSFNNYNPAGGGTWAQLPPAACNIQDGGGTQQGFFPASDVDPRGYIIVSGRDAKDQAFDNRVYTQSVELDCTVGEGTKIGPSNYRANYGLTTTTLAEPLVEVSLIGADTIIHLVGSENIVGSNYGRPTTSGLRGETVVQYFRKVNNWDAILADSVNWSAAKTIDTAGSRPNITAQRTGSKVAVIYAEITPRGFTDSAGWGVPVFGAATTTTLDMDLCYRESTDGGLNFGSKVNVTNYGNRLVKTYGMRTEYSGLYDSDNNLHIIFRGDPWPAGIYDSGQSFFFYDFSGAVLHWSQSAGAVTRAGNAEWGLAWNTVVCGFGGQGYVARPMISECDGNIYAVWSQFHDIRNVAALGDTLLNDFQNCTGLTGWARGAAASTEIWMSVSSDKTGLLWDKPRNLTNTPSRNCDSATGNGLCFAERWISLQKEGTNVPVVGNTWPTGSTIDPTGSYAGNFFINALFLDDRYPGASGTQANLGPADMKFARIACVDPVVAASISVSPLSGGYPDFVKHGQQRVITVTVTNDGNAALNVSEITAVVTSGPGGVITRSVSSLNVPAGVVNTATFNITINPGGAVNAPGTVVPAIGYVFLKSNAANDDSVAIGLTFVIADTVVLSAFDTVSTGTIQLALSTNGAEGLSGITGANLDYVNLGADCDSTASTYLFSGGQFANRRIGAGNFVFTGSTFSDNIDDFTWKPLVDLPGGPTDRGFTATGAYQRFSTGLVVSKDTTIGCERVWFAPLGGAPNNDFIIVCTKYWIISGSQSALQFGDVHDFDIPAINGALNIDGTESGEYVWLRGTEGATANCASMAARFGANVPLGQRMSGTLCGNDAPYAQYSINNTNDLQLNTNGSGTGVIHPDTSWDRAAGFNAIGNLGTDSVDMRIVTVWKHNFTLNAGDTLYTYSALTTVKTGTAADLKANAAAACLWYQTNVRPGCTLCGCCELKGDVFKDGSVDLVDLSVLVDHLFISFTPLGCVDEGDVFIDGGVDLVDLSVLVDHLFISFTPLPGC